VVVSGQFNYTKGAGSMPFLLSVLLSFQGSTHLLGVGSFSKEDLLTDSLYMLPATFCHFL